MSVGAAFLLVLLLIVLAILGGALYAVAMWLRGKKLDPERDKIEGRGPETPPRPEHVEVENEQRSRFVGSR